MARGQDQSQSVIAAFKNHNFTFQQRRAYIFSMTYELFIGDRTFSSWSLRGWLMFEKFNIPYRSHMMGLYSDSFAEDMAAIAPARTVPAIRTPDGDLLGETLAIAETLHERHPDAGLWPSDESARIFARWLVSEMHAGFGALRGDCPMQLAHQFGGFAPSDAVKADLKRIEELWALAIARFGGDGPWLFGEYCAADAFFAPVAARIAGYGLPVGPAAAAYVAAHLQDTAFRRWRAMGATVTYDPFPYTHPGPINVWPGPDVIKASICDGPSENDACPYSGKPVTDFLKIDGRVFGFCNLFCRDKTLSDPAAWPAFMEIYTS